MMKQQFKATQPFACTVRWTATLVIFITALILYAPLQAQNDAQEEDLFDDDELFLEDEFGGEFDDAGYFESDDPFGDEGFFEDEGGFEYGDEGFYEEDAFFDDEGFEDDFSDEFLDDLDVEGEAEGLDLADDQAGEVALQEIEQREIKPPRPKRGYTLKVAAVSPWYAGLGLDAWWYSYIDGRLALDIPQKTRLGGLTLSYTFEVTSFGFTNYHPAGGKLAGVALAALVRMPLGPLTASAGLGVYGGETITSGGIFGLGYTIPFIKFIDITAESRLTYLQQGTPAGGALWLDVGGSIGYQF